MKPLFSLIVLCSLITCSMETKKTVTSGPANPERKTIKVNFQVVDMQQIGWGTIYTIRFLNTGEIPGSILSDTAKLYISVGNNIHAKPDLHALKKETNYLAVFSHTDKKSQTAYIPAGNSGFIDNNNEIWDLIRLSEKEMRQRITITGIALNAKLGAIVRSEDDEYYIDGLDEWPEKLHRKKVRVTGYFRSEYHNPKNLITKDGFHKTGMSGEKRSLQDAQWEIIDKR